MLPDLSHMKHERSYPVAFVGCGDYDAPTDARSGRTPTLWELNTNDRRASSDPRAREGTCPLAERLKYKMDDIKVELQFAQTNLEAKRPTEQILSELMSNIRRVLRE